MEILKATYNPAPWQAKLALRPVGAPTARPVPVALEPAASAAADPPKKEAEGHLAPLLAKGVALEGIYKGGSFVLSQVNGVTSDHVAAVLRQNNLVRDPGLAQSQADKIVNFVQSKGAHAVLIGAIAGTGMMTAVDMVRPQWPLWSKATIGLVTAALVAALLYFGLEDKPVGAGPPAVQVQAR